MRRLALSFGIGAALVLMGIGGCKTVPLRTPDVLDVAPSLSLADTRLAVFQALAVPVEVESQLTRREAMADRALRIGLWPFYRGVNSEQMAAGWFAESVEEDSVRAIYQRRGVVLKVDVRIARGAIAFEIVDAENLKFSGKSIHKSAYVWIGQLKEKIRRSLGQVALQRAAETDLRTDHPALGSAN